MCPKLDLLGDFCVDELHLPGGGGVRAIGKFVPALVAVYPLYDGNSQAVCCCMVDQHGFQVHGFFGR